MLHPDTELRFISPSMGYGVFATRPIPKGTITWARDALDQTIPDVQGAAMPRPLREMLEKYAYQDQAGVWVLCWDLARYVNHSCEATCLSPGYDFEIAVRDLEPGDELTDDYGSLNLHAPFPCECGSPRCRGTILPDDTVRLAPTWDEQLASPFAEILSVDQPLWPLVRGRRGVANAVRAGRPPRSSALHYSGGPGSPPPITRRPSPRRRRRKAM